MKRVIIIHCRKGYPEYCWYPWVKKELEAKDFEVNVPDFPNTGKPKLNEYNYYRGFYSELIKKSFKLYKFLVEK